MRAAHAALAKAREEPGGHPRDMVFERVVNPLVRRSRKMKVSSRCPLSAMGPLVALEMGHEPVSSRSRSALEIFHVSVEVTSGEHDELLRLERALVGGKRLVNNGEVVAEGHD